MGNIPFAPSQIYDDREHGRSIRDLLVLQGQNRADAALRSGDAQAQLWGGVSNAIGSVGQAVQQHQEQKQAKEQMRARDKATLEVFSSFKPGENDDEVMGRLVNIRGMDDGLKMFNGLREYKTPAHAKPEDEARRVGLALDVYSRLDTDEARAAAFPNLIQNVGPSLKKMGLTVPEEFGPDVPKLAVAARDSIFTVYGIKGPEAEKPKMYESLEPGANGEPVKVLRTQEEMQQGRPQYVKAEAPSKGPEMGTFEAYAAAKGATTPAAMLKARAEWQAAGREPQTIAAPEELTLNPEGVVLTGYGVKQKDQARKQAQERGIPVFENSTTQVKGMTLKGIVDEAKELDQLLQKKEVQDSIGRFAGNWTALKGGWVDLPPDVQRAVQLMGSLSDTELRKRSGASVTEPEFKRLLQFSVNLTKPLGHNLTAIRGMLKAGSRDYKSLSGVSIWDESPAAAPADAPKQINSQAEFDALPSGALFIGTGGRTMRKK